MVRNDATNTVCRYAEPVHQTISKYMTEQNNHVQRMNIMRHECRKRIATETNNRTADKKIHKYDGSDVRSYHLAICPEL